ncbi:MAG: hypothetical protein JWP69_287 [Flaviaesturariibacter sp.]|nr:hypothetical protein [Flaviaesturariibacter sp.]
MKQREEPNRGYLATVVGCYCPRCREGKLFQHTTSVKLRRNLLMYEKCLSCGQLTDIEVGFYYGTGFVSYFICILFSVLSFLLWWLVLGFSYNDNRFIYWVILNASFLLLSQPWLMRFSRSLWISWFVSYDPQWRTTKPFDTGRLNADQMTNW